MDVKTPDDAAACAHESWEDGFNGRDARCNDCGAGLPHVFVEAPPKLDIVERLRIDPATPARQFEREARAVLGNLLDEAADEIVALRHALASLNWNGVS